MAETMKLELTQPETEQLKVLLEEANAVLHKSQQQMAQEQSEIEQLKAETREILGREWGPRANVEAILRLHQERSLVERIYAN